MVAAVLHLCLRHRTLQQQDAVRLVLGEVDSSIEQRLVGDDAARFDTAGGVRIATGLLSSRRVASSGAAKPPNTTEWMAPMRAQASMPIAASGIIGM